ncbi:hypothetical protein JRQ81_006107 [Phrynocephalus forsythii]|uniref:Uncharacterized protein n=1 Tax=Phrynocephalus forsythii TaxID=171643 RepID=A0A9Q0XEL9_9SAUR|nr:hypothetical protein JRQ81_006107 [Phrynocephalus forsythii]
MLQISHIDFYGTCVNNDSMYLCLSLLSTLQYSKPEKKVKIARPNNVVYNIKVSFTCSSTNVIYAVFCQQCPSVPNIGQIGQSPRSLITNLTSDFTMHRNPSQTISVY